MILVDTAVWIDHFREMNEQLVVLLRSEKVRSHPLVVGEIAMGSLKDRKEILLRLDRLKTTPLVRIEDARALIESKQLYSRGIGLVDAMLLASCLVHTGTRLWTWDRRLAKCAKDLGIAYQPLH